jgi:hypothetical protein
MRGVLPARGVVLAVKIAGAGARPVQNGFGDLRRGGGRRILVTFDTNCPARPASVAAFAEVTWPKA